MTDTIEDMTVIDMIDTMFGRVIGLAGHRAELATTDAARERAYRLEYVQYIGCLEAIIVELSANRVDEVKYVVAKRMESLSARN